MPRGGPGRGGGRKKGGVNKKTAALRAITAKALKSGVTPLEVMLGNMRFYHDEAARILSQVLAGVGKRPSLEMIEALKSVCSFRGEAEVAARDAAPYMHPRLSAIAVKGNINSNVKMVQGAMSAEEAAEAYASTLKDDDLP